LRHFLVHTSSPCRTQFCIWAALRHMHSIGAWVELYHYHRLVLLVVNANPANKPRSFTKYIPKNRSLRHSQIALTSVVLAVIRLRPRECWGLKISLRRRSPTHDIHLNIRATSVGGAPSHVSGSKPVLHRCRPCCIS